jgi:hypothetical protein
MSSADALAMIQKPLAKIEALISYVSVNQIDLITLLNETSPEADTLRALLRCLAGENETDEVKTLQHDLKNFKQVNASKETEIERLSKLIEDADNKDNQRLTELTQLKQTIKSKILENQQLSTESSKLLKSNLLLEQNITQSTKEIKKLHEDLADKENEAKVCEKDLIEKNKELKASEANLEIESSGNLLKEDMLKKQLLSEWRYSYYEKEFKKNVNDLWSMIQSYNKTLKFDNDQINQIKKVIINWQKEQLLSHEKSNEADQKNPDIYPKPISSEDYDNEYNVGGSRTRRRRKPVLTSKRKKTLKKKKSSRR